jgi:hypothetical protein
VRAGERVPADTDLPDGLAVHRHLSADSIAGHSGHDAEVVDNQSCVNRRTTELLVVGQRCALRLAAVDHEESTEVTAMRIEQRHIHPCDPAVGLHAPEHLDELAEYFDSPFLATAYRRAEPNEQGSIGHHDSFLSLDAPNLSEPAAPRKPIRDDPVSREVLAAVACWRLELYER